MKLKGILKNSGLASKLMILVGMSLMFGTVASLIFVSITPSDSQSIDALKLLQLAESAGIFILPAIFSIFLFSQDPYTVIGRIKKTTIADYILVGLLMLTLIPFINYISEWNQQLRLPAAFANIEAWMKTSEATATSITERFLNVHNLGALAFNLLLVAAMPALGEELYFRAVIQRSIIERTNIIQGVLITAFVFSAIHIQFYGLVPRFLLGALLGFLYVWSSNLWLPIFAHFVNNSTAVIFYYLKFNHYQTIDVDTIGTNATTWMVLPSIGLSALGIILIHKRLKQSNSIC